MSYMFDQNLRDAITANLDSFTPTAMEPEGLKQAAVAVTIVANAENDGQASMLLTRRTARLSSHARQWALPGGRVDAGEDPFDAALREMHEEVNLRLDKGAYLGKLDDLATRSGYVITPYVFWADDLSELKPNPDEVASIHRIPIALFEGEEAVQFIDQDHTEAPLLRLQLGEHRMHSPTAAFLLQLWEVGVQGRNTRVADFAQPDWAK